MWWLGTSHKGFVKVLEVLEIALHVKIILADMARGDSEHTTKLNSGYKIHVVV
jgi:hypothetical protein